LDAYFDLPFLLKLTLKQHFCEFNSWLPRNVFK